jgi:hypothetical protein
MPIYTATTVTTTGPVSYNSPNNAQDGNEATYALGATFDKGPPDTVLTLANYQNTLGLLPVTCTLYVHHWGELQRSGASYAGTTRCRIEYSIDGGANWIRIVDHDAPSLGDDHPGLYTWDDEHRVVVPVVSPIFLQIREVLHSERDRSGSNPEFVDSKVYTMGVEASSLFPASMMGFC